MKFKTHFEHTFNIDVSIQEFCEIEPPAFQLPNPSFALLSCEISEPH